MLNARCHAAGMALAVIIILMFFTTSALADALVTVTTKDGEVYQDVTYKVNRNYKIIKLENEEFEKNVSFSNIASIVDQDGTDITSSVLGDYYKQEERPWVSKESRTFKRATARPWEAILRLGLNFSIPTGDYYEGIGSGVGFEGDLRYAVTNHLAIRGGVSKSGMRSTTDPVYYSNDPGIEVVDTEFHISGIRYMLGAEYYAKLDRVSESQDYLYLLSYLGAITHKMETRVTLENIYTHEQATGIARNTQSKFLFGLGFGLTKLLGRNYGLETGMTFEFIPVATVPSDLYGSETVYAYIIDFKLGFVGFAL